ncbi:MAG: hypothetical protein KGP28_12650 [Bdellovibrionales bacterium]|nr:hypothetical protein [Bdellovibrionales bacterium]
MKTLIKITSIAILIACMPAKAAQFEIFVAHPANEAAVQAEFLPLLQKSIFIDTDAKTLRLPRLPQCDLQMLCTESIHWTIYQITKARFTNRSPTAISGVMGSSQILITTTPDRTTLIRIFNSKGSNEAQFIGSAVQPTRFLN